MKFTALRSVGYALIFCTILTLSLSYYWPIQDPYHPSNQDWNGCSKLVSLATNLEILYSLNALPLNGNSSLLALIGPDIGFSQDDGSRIGKFLQSGGNVLLTDSFGTGNTLLAALNISTRSSGKHLADIYSYSLDPSFPLIGNLSQSPITANVTTIVLNQPSYLDIPNASNITILGFSSPFSFIDLKGTGIPAANETLESYPVMGVAKVGQGNLILIADSGLFINEMIDLYDNARLFQNMLKIAKGSLHFDISHVSRAALTDWRISYKEQLKSALEVVAIYQRNPYAQVFVTIMIVGFFTAMIFRRKRDSNVSS